MTLYVRIIRFVPILRIDIIFCSLQKTTMSGCVEIYSLYQVYAIVSQRKQKNVTGHVIHAFLKNE